MESFLLFVCLIVLVVRWLVLRERLQQMAHRLEVLEVRLDARTAAPLAPPPVVPRRASEDWEASAGSNSAPPAPAPAPAPPPPAPRRASEDWEASAGSNSAPPAPAPAPAPPPPAPRRASEDWEASAGSNSAPPAPAPRPHSPEPAPRRASEDWEASAGSNSAPPAPAPRPHSPEPAPRRASESWEAIVGSNPAPPRPHTPEPAPRRTSEDWEAIVGGNWMNKLGVLVLVIGCALFLRYSLLAMGPAGRSASALALSCAMLAAGVLLEAREAYRIFARGLIGGGWAALYFTVYAMQDIAAARVIHNPLLGGLLLIAVAAGMIGHSLRYRSQTITGLAYFVAFATLAITPLSVLAMAALVPLAVSMLYIASRFAWSRMAFFGLFTTYGICWLRGDAGAPLWAAQSVLAWYWLMFECFDVVRPSPGIFALNALAISILTFARWMPGPFYWPAAGLAAAYAAGTATRLWVRRSRYEAPLALASAFAFAAVLLYDSGRGANPLLLAEAELLFLAGVIAAQRYPRILAAICFAGAVIKLVVCDLTGATQLTVAGITFWSWMPGALLAAALFYFNRALDSRGWGYSYAASIGLAAIAGVQAPTAQRPQVLLAFATILFGLGFVRRLIEFRVQAYLVATAALMLLAVDLTNPGLAIAAALGYAAAMVTLWATADRFDDEEREMLQSASSLTAAAALAALIWRLAPQSYQGTGWMALALVLLELGQRRLPSQLRIGACALFAAGVFVAAVQNLLPLTSHPALWAAAVLAYAFAARSLQPLASYPGGAFLFAAIWAVTPHNYVAAAWSMAALILLEAGRRLRIPALEWQGHAGQAAAGWLAFAVNFAPGGIAWAATPVVAAYYVAAWRGGLRPYLYSAAFLGSAVIVNACPPVWIAAALAGYATALVATAHPDLRQQSYAIATIAFLSCCWQSLAHAWTAVPTIAAYLIAQRLLPAVSHGRPFYALLAAATTTVLIGHEVSGSMLTVCWGVEGLCLLAAGFPLHDRNFRLSGLALLGVCTAKLFAYDLRSLDTPYRILSFIALGLILLAVSWVYARYREHVRRIL